MDNNNLTITANVIEGTSLNPDVTVGSTVQVNVVYGTPVTANVVTGGKGDKGDTGVGVPAGGATGQVLVKNSDADYATEWGFNLTISSTPPSSPSLNDLWVDTA